jgi:hypothetical protein
MADPDRIAAALRYQQELEAAQRPATMNPNLAAQGRRMNLPARQKPGPLSRFTNQAVSLDPQPDQGYGTMAAEMALGFVPGVGQAMAARDIERARRDNDPVGMGMAAASFIPVGKLINALRGSKQMGPVSDLITYHGTPHRFPPTAKNPLGEFDPMKIGTGEGAQAYGHGLYLAENPGVATDYAKTLGPKTALSNPEYVAAQARLAKFEDAVSKRYKQDALSPMEDIAFYSEKYPKRVINAANKIQTAEQAAYEKASKGSLYKVDLPDEQIAKMLDWDKPLSQQPKEVQKALRENELWNVVPEGKSLGEMVQAMNRSMGPERTSNILRELNIPGIRYLDQGSRGAPSSAMFTKSDVVGAADDLTEFAKSLGLDAKVQHSGSNAGKSSYVSVFDPTTNRYIKSSFRISDHGTGPLRHQEHIHVSSPAALVAQKNELFEWTKRNRTEKGIDITGLNAPKQGTSNFVVFDPAHMNIIGRE